METVHIRDVNQYRNTVPNTISGVHQDRVLKNLRFTNFRYDQLAVVRYDPKKSEKMDVITTADHSWTPERIEKAGKAVEDYIVKFQQEGDAVLVLVHPESGQIVYDFTWKLTFAWDIFTRTPPASADKQNDYYLVIWEEGTQPNIEEQIAWVYNSGNMLSALYVREIGRDLLSGKPEDTGQRLVLAYLKRAFGLNTSMGTWELQQVGKGATPYRISQETESGAILYLTNWGNVGITPDQQKEFAKSFGQVIDQGAGHLEKKDRKVKLSNIMALGRIPYSHLEAEVEIDVSLPCLKKVKAARIRDALLYLVPEDITARDLSISEITRALGLAFNAVVIVPI